MVLKYCVKKSSVYSYSQYSYLYINIPPHQSININWTLMLFLALDFKAFGNFKHSITFFGEFIAKITKKVYNKFS